MPTQAPERVRGGKGSPTGYKVTEVTADKVMMIEEMHTEGDGCLYRWRRAGPGVGGDK